jgi:hypothetical protein
VAIYDALFASISTDLDIKSAISHNSALQVCRCIRSEALPRMLHFVRLRVAALGETVDSLAMVMGTAPLFSPAYNDMELQATCFRNQHLEFRVLEGILRIMEAVGKGGIQTCDVRRRSGYDVKSPEIVGRRRAGRSSSRVISSMSHLLSPARELC